MTAVTRQGGRCDVGARDELHSYGQCVYEPGDWVEWRCIDAAQRIERDWILAEHLADQAQRLAKLNAAGFNIYIGANRREGPGRTTDAGVDLCRTVFVDFDHLANEEGASYDDLASGRIEEAGLPLPTLRVFSGHGIHAYWRLAEPVKPGVWAPAQERLIKALDTDPKIKNPERIMRLPGFLNVKDAGHPADCFIIDADPARVYDLAAILARCQGKLSRDLIDPVDLVDGRRVTPTAQRSSGSGESRLDDRVARYAAAWPHCGEGSRNNEAYLHACQLVCDFGVAEGAALELLRSWNAGNQPPLPDPELISVVKSAAVHHRFTPGAKRDRPPAPRTTQQTPHARPHREPGEDPSDETSDGRRTTSHGPQGPQTTQEGGQRAIRWVEDAIGGTVIDWPWPQLTELTEMPAPGTVLALCGPPGSTKTFFVLQALCGWVEAGHAADMLIMEEDIEHILARHMAQAAGEQGLTSPRWIKAHADEAREHAQRLCDANDRLGRHLYDLPVADIGLPAMARWVQERIDAGSKILIVDPITAAVQSDSPWITERAFINGAKRAAREAGVSIILTTHPKLGQSDKIFLDSLASSASAIRFCQGVLWLEALDEEQPTPTISRYDPFPEMRMVNRIVHILKARNARGRGQKVGYRFDSGKLTFDEVGIIKKAKRKRKGQEEAGEW